MEIKQAEFVTSMARYGNFPGRGLDQIAVVGKSNVGKSSLINRLCNRKALARTSSTPGKTRLINVFLLNGAFHLVDLPGYGYAKVDKQEKQRWGAMMQEYFEQAEEVPLDVTVYLAFVRFLIRLVSQIAMAARSGTELAADARSFPAPLFPAPFQEMLADAGTIFTASEGRIRQFALDSLEIAAPAIDKIREDCRKAMPKVAKERYERAFEAFTAHFANMGVEDTTQ